MRVDARPSHPWTVIRLVASVGVALLGSEEKPRCPKRRCIADAVLQHLPLLFVGAWDVLRGYLRFVEVEAVGAQDVGQFAHETLAARTRIARQEHMLQA